MAEVTFDEQLRFGKVGEGRIARWLIAKGYSVLPIYEKERETGKGPVLYSADGVAVAPDMVVYKGAVVKWLEAKTKSSFSWHRISGEWRTGIDLRHYEEYLKVARAAPWELWLLFLHLNPTGAKDTPLELVGKSPVGLFGNALSYLEKHEGHRHPGWGNSGMVYWGHAHLRLLAEIGDVLEG